MSIRTAFLSAFAAGTVLIAAVPAGAQGYGRPPAPIGGYDDDDAPSPRNVAGSDDAAGLTIRIDKLENQMRQLNGQIEQLQFANRRLEDQLKKFQGDVDFRFQDLGHGAASRPQKRGDASEGTTPSGGTAVAEAVPVAPSARGRRSDAFDPTSEPNAPGAPRPIGGLPAAASDTLARRRRGLDHRRSRARCTARPLRQPAARQRGRGGRSAHSLEHRRSAGRRTDVAGGAGAAAVTPGGTVIASTGPSGPKEEFDVALGYYKDKQYDNAEKGFAALAQKNPKARITPDALYYLGETFYQRGRQREAAEQFLKISTDYASAPRAPDAMLRLGQSLNALGAKEQACATFGEIGRKYPNATTAKSGAEREAKRLQCPAT